MWKSRKLLYHSLCSEVPIHLSCLCLSGCSYVCCIYNDLVNNVKVSVAEGHLHSKSIKCEIPEMNNSYILNCVVFWVVWWNDLLSFSVPTGCASSLFFSVSMMHSSPTLPTGVCSKTPSACLKHIAYIMCVCVYIMMLFSCTCTSMIV
jgi:hypothetical protein